MCHTECGTHSHTRAQPWANRMLGVYLALNEIFEMTWERCVCSLHLQHNASNNAADGTGFAMLHSVCLSAKRTNQFNSKYSMQRLDEHFCVYEWVAK